MLNYYFSSKLSKLKLERERKKITIIVYYFYNFILQENSL